MFSILCFISQKGKNTNETHTKDLCSALWLIKHVKSGLRSCVLEISCWMVLHSQGDQLKLRVINRDSNWEQSELCHTGDSWCTRNIQIDKVIGENEKCLILQEKLNKLFGQPSNIPCTRFGKYSIREILRRQKQQSPVFDHLRREMRRIKGKMVSAPPSQL